VAPGSRRRAHARQDLEGGREQQQVEQQRAGQRRQVAAEPRPRGSHLRQGGRHQQRGDHQQQRREAAGQPRPEARPGPARDVPDRVHGVLGGAGDAQAPPQGAEDADEQPHAGTLDGLDAVLDLGPEHGELRDRRVDHAPLEVLVVRERVAEHGDEHQQQREQRQEAVVGEQRGVLADAIVTGLADHGDGQPDQRVPPLEAVDGAQRPLDQRGGAPVPRLRAHTRSQPDPHRPGRHRPGQVISRVMSRPGTRPAWGPAPG
jgi:hypothetical protein